jgi:hypothetical protein
MIIQISTDTPTHTHTSLNKLFGGYFFFFSFFKKEKSLDDALTFSYTNERTNALMAINLMLAGVAERDDPPTIPGRG